MGWASRLMHAPHSAAGRGVPLILASAVLVLVPPKLSVHTTRPLHIHHGHDVATPAQLAAHAALVDSRPLDGVTVRLPRLSDETLVPVAHSRAEYARALSPMPTLRHVTHNFVLVRTLRPPSWYDDAAWTRINKNLANLAAAARAKGQFDGVFLDVEFYGNGAYPWDFGSGRKAWAFSATHGATPHRSARDANATVATRGRQAGEAIAGAWPTATVLTTYGPWVGEPATVTSGGWRAFGYNDVAWRNELMGSFTGGLVEAARTHPRMTYVDGGEVYQAHYADEYSAAYRWMKSGIAASGSRVVRSPGTYGRTVSVAFGVYDKDIRARGWPTMSPVQWQQVLTNALKTADRYVWSYSEAYDWLGTGTPRTPVPPTILAATTVALTAARHPA